VVFLLFFKIFLSVCNNGSVLHQDDRSAANHSKTLTSAWLTAAEAAASASAAESGTG